MVTGSPLTSWSTRLLVLCLSGVLSVVNALAGAFQIMEEPPRDAQAAAVRHHLRAQGDLRMWTMILTELFALPADVTIVLAPCGRIDAFYTPAQRRIHLCDELLTYFTQAFAPSDAAASPVHAATLFTFFHLAGHALIQVLDLPGTGPAEETADELGAVFLVAGNASDEQAVLAGSQAIFRRSHTPAFPRDALFWSRHPWTIHRYLHLRCLLYGSAPTRHAVLLQSGTFSAERAQQCIEDWQRRQQHWNTVLAPHLRSEEAPTPAPPPAPLALLPEAPPAPLPVPVTDTPSPDQVLRTYYEALNQRQYARTWLMLAPQFKHTHFCCEADGSYQFPRYRAWWESVERVEVLAARVQERQPQEVVMRATVKYQRSVQRLE